MVERVNKEEPRFTSFQQFWLQEKCVLLLPDKIVSTWIYTICTYYKTFAK